MQAGSQLAETDEQNARSVATVKQSYAVIECCRTEKAAHVAQRAVLQISTIGKQTGEVLKDVSYRESDITCEELSR